MHKFVGLGGLKAVDSLLITWDNSLLDCVQKVHNLGLVHSAKKSFLSYAQTLHSVCTVLMNKFFSQLTPTKAGLYTQSTKPIITIYLYKGEQ